MYHGYTESPEKIADRMNRCFLLDFAVTYDWEQVADKIHALISAAEAGDKHIAEHADWLDEQRTIEDARA